MLTNMLKLPESGALRSVRFASKRSALGKIHGVNRRNGIDGWWPQLSRGTHDPVLLQDEGFGNVCRSVALATPRPASFQTRRARPYIALILSTVHFQRI